MTTDLERLAALDGPFRDAQGHPLLRVPCRDKHTEWVGFGYGQSRSHEQVGCPAWVPVSGAEAVVALMDACRSLPEYMGVSFTARGQVALSLVHLPVLYRSCDTDLEALAAALWAAVEADKRGPNE